MIIGAKTVEQLDDNLAAAEIELTADEIVGQLDAAIEAAARVSGLDARAAGRAARCPNPLRQEG